MSDGHGESYPQEDDKQRNRMVRFTDREFKKAEQTLMRRICVMVAYKEGTIALRDSKDPTRTTLYFNEDEWVVFIRGVRNGEFDYGLT